MKNFVQKGDVLTAIAPTGGVSSGEGVLLNGLFGVAAFSAAEGEEFEHVIEGVVTLPKESPLAVNYGDRLFWNDTAGEVTTTATGNFAIGFAAETLGAITSEITVKLRGSTPVAT